MFELQELAKETVDIKGIGLYTLGKFRKEISDEQKIKYSKLFENYFLKSFFKSFVRIFKSKNKCNFKRKKTINIQLYQVFLLLLKIGQR